jgi:uncharacterized ubiquitin-like protein YukD
MLILKYYYSISKEMKVIVNVVRIGEYNVNVEETTTLHDLRKKISKIAKEAKHSRIFLHDKILSGDELLSNYDIVDGSKLDFIPCIESGKSEKKKEKEKIDEKKPETKKEKPKVVPYEEHPVDEKEKHDIQVKLEKFREELKHRKEEEMKKKVEPKIEPKEESYVRPPFPAVMERLVDPVAIDIPKDYYEEKELTEEQNDAVSVIMSMLPPHKFTERYVKFMYVSCDFNSDTTANVLMGQ